MNHFISLAAFALFASQFLFIGNFVWSLFKGKKAEQNPWRDNGLEWTLPNPAPHGNWEKLPTVYRGPYEYSMPGAPDDWYPQSSKLPNDREPAPAPSAAH
jgi:cytochrome c oxidase subunit 1